MSERKYLSKGIDYLGDLSSKLRDLVGFTSLANELIQNADDAPRATFISFDVSETGLTVDNDGVFAACPEIGSVTCEWKNTKDRMCDFHRFRKVASGDKRNQPDTTGAFGIGFISVYQITDRPELMSAGQHWRIDEAQVEEKRIEICGNHECARCRHASLPGTRFFLPWAEDPNSTLRKALRAETIGSKEREQLSQQLMDHISRAALFLRRVKFIQLSRSSEHLRQLQKSPEGRIIRIDDGTTKRDWLFVQKDFRQLADELRKKHRDSIERNRSVLSTVAIPKEPLDIGLLYATLPTQHSTKLPFHVNGSFYPSSDRKRVIFEHDYQSEWNRLVLKSAAQGLAEEIGSLNADLGGKRLWEVIESCEKVAKGNQSDPLSVFWKALSPKLSQHPIVLTTLGEWKHIKDCCFLESEDETPSVPCLERLGIDVVHGELRPHHNIIRACGVGRLEISQIVAGLRRLNLTCRTESTELEKVFNGKTDFQFLLKELSFLLERRGDASTQRSMKEALSGCAISKGIDGAWWPPAEVFRADKSTIELFRSLVPTIGFVDATSLYEQIAKLSPEFDERLAVDFLAHLTADQTNRAATEGKLVPEKLLGWFASHSEKLVCSPETKAKLIRLPIFPTTDELRPLSELSLPGDFEDPLGLANIVDIERTGRRREFLGKLGAQPLTFKEYVRVHVPQAFARGTLSPAKKRNLVELVAVRLGDIRDDIQLRRLLCSLEIVECKDGNFRVPSQVYFQEQEVVSVLGTSGPFAVISGDRSSALREFYRWLGVATEPRIGDITSMIQQVVIKAPTDKSKQSIERIVHHWGKRSHRDPDSFVLPPAWQSLAWLPARGTNKWWKPTEVYAGFQAYLFESQAKFLDLAPRVQQESVEFLEALGVRTTPTVLQIVNHLLHCSAQRIPVNKDVYRVLNDSASENSILALRNKPCLLLPNNNYVRPDQVFWELHNFARFRYMLGEDLQKYAALFARIGVKQRPDTVDAINVIKEISSAFSSSNSPLDDDAFHTLYEAWHMLGAALESGEIQSSAFAVLKDLKVIPNSERVLNKPDWMFFDDRAGLAQRFGDFLRTNAIPKPEGAWRAMAAVGVQSLSAAVRVDVIEHTDPIADDRVLQRLQSRREQLTRVLEVQGDTFISTRARLLVENVKTDSVSELKIRFSLKAFNKERSTAPEDVQAHYARDDNTLYFIRNEGVIPWSSVARELALAVLPDGEPGVLAMAFKEILEADTEESLRTTLDELGFASLLATSASTAGPEAAIVQELGGECEDNNQFSSSDFLPKESDLDVHHEHRHDSLSMHSQDLNRSTPVRSLEVESLTEGRGGSADPTADNAVQSLLGTEAPSPTPVPPELVEQIKEPVFNGIRSSTGSKQPSISREQSKLVSYVTRDGNQHGDTAQIEQSLKRKAIDDAGIARVKVYEESKGRVVDIKPPGHRGYDIESKDHAGDVIRYIEVKSLSGVWGKRGVEVHKKQFEVAQLRLHKYWLYIVERAEADDFCIYRIQNPAGEVDNFVFDYGWHEIAEADEN